MLKEVCTNVLCLRPARPDKIVQGSCAYWQHGIQEVRQLCKLEASACTLDLVPDELLGVAAHNCACLLTQPFFWGKDLHTQR